MKAADLVITGLGLELEWRYKNKLAVVKGNGLESRFHFIDIDTSMAASSEIKFRFQMGKEVPQGWLPQDVLGHIVQHKLYKKDVCNDQS